MPFIDNLKRRRLLEWGLAYLGMAWLALQVLDVLNEVWPISAGFQRATHVLLVLGLPPLVVVAWFHGERGRQSRSRPEVLLLTVLALLAAGALFLLNRSNAKGEWLVLSLSVAAMASIPTLAAFAWRLRGDVTTAALRSAWKETREDRLLAQVEDLRRRLLVASDVATLERLTVEVAPLLEANPDNAEVRLLGRQVELAMRAAVMPMTTTGAGPAFTAQEVEDISALYRQEGSIVARALAPRTPDQLRKRLIALVLASLVFLVALPQAMNTHFSLSSQWERLLPRLLVILAFGAALIATLLTTRRARGRAKSKG